MASYSDEPRASYRYDTGILFGAGRQAAQELRVLCGGRHWAEVPGEGPGAGRKGEGGAGGAFFFPRRGEQGTREVGGRWSSEEEEEGRSRGGSLQASGGLAAEERPSPRGLANGALLVRVRPQAGPGPNGLAWPGLARRGRGMDSLRSRSVKRGGAARMPSHTCGKVHAGYR